MRFKALPIEGAFLIELTPIEDERGFFARSYSAAEFAGRGLEAIGEECSISFNPRKGTLRGMHYQLDPHGEAKLIRCSRGAIFDVGIDLRPGSATFKRHCTATLDSGLQSVYLPPGVAHGYITLEKSTELNYQMSAPYIAESATGVRWDDPEFQIDWPLAPVVISERDRSFANFRA